MNVRFLSYLNFKSLLTIVTSKNKEWSERLKGRNIMIGVSVTTISKAFLQDGYQINIKLSSHSII